MRPLILVYGVRVYRNMQLSSSGEITKLRRRGQSGSLKNAKVMRYHNTECHNIGVTIQSVTKQGVIIQSVTI